MADIDVEVKIHHETEKAYLVSTTSVMKMWIPKYINGDLYPVDEGEKGWAIITVPEWFAIDKELI